MGTDRGDVSHLLPYTRKDLEIFNGTARVKELFDFLPYGN